MVAETPRFGFVLRQLRLAAGLSQKMLAERAGISAGAISELERNPSRVPRFSTIALLADALQIDQPDRARLLAAAQATNRLMEPAPASPIGLPLAGLPYPLPRLFGRDNMIGAVAALIRSAAEGMGEPLLTLTGPGGVGKTRLALAVTATLTESFAPIAFAPLATIRDPDMVLPAMASALGIREQGDADLLPRVEAALAGQRALLVVDNLEHLPGAAPAVAAMLRACPGLTMLATSRSPLHVTGERVVPLSPLALPASGAACADIAASPAVALLITRAQAVAPDFGLTEQNAAAVAEICRRLDGLPLALELAASHLRVLSPTALLDRLAPRLPLLVSGARDLPARLQTLRNAIAWSYDLLSPVEQVLFRRLAIFIGGWTLETAEAVAGDSRLSPVGDTLAGIEALVDQHLIERAGEVMDQPRFVMLETIREFAWEQLIASGEDALVGLAHADYFLAFAVRGERILYDGPDPLTWLARLESDHPNLRAALTRFLTEGEVGAALRMAGALTPFWFQHSHLGEGQAWLEKTLAAPGANEAAPEARASACFGLGMLSLFFHQDLTRAAAAMVEAATLAETANDSVAIAMAQIGESQIRLFRGEYASAARLAVEARTRLEAAGEHQRALFGDFVEARAAHHSGNWSKAEALYDALLRRAEEFGAIYHVVASLQSLALLAQARGDAALAARRFTAALRGFWDLGELWNVAACLEGIAIAGSTHPSPRAPRLLGAAARLRQVIGAPMLPADRPAYEQALKAIRGALGDRAFDAGWNAGAELTLDAAVAEALAMIAEEPEASPAADEPVLTGASPLTRREQEVLRLVVDGLADREIAQTLYITRRTASQHVGAILAKLGVASRTAAATRAVRDHLV